ncbi:hypothetical protein BDV95DRAFT_106347 [Massariosphaeria phaeospora]|uniref:ubiquitinyl hydrolase 1 n=1 Tax=Massariosphaeria phaeospora TaxID=100035 RepID=A0A7C8I294_9PLEO|nr:hypothetical protein BDV95DRAFT_106347 [Massariosphaeria phaeospora]
MSSGLPGKTAPRLLQDLLTYDPRHEERAGRNLLTTAPPHYNPDPAAPRSPAVPNRNCRHVFLNKSEQSKPPRHGEDAAHDTVYKVAAFCSKCLWHLDLTVDFRDNGNRSTPCRPGTDFALHHFQYRPDPEEEARGSPVDRPHERNHSFSCSAPKCPVDVHIRLTPPRFDDQDIVLLTDRAVLRKRWEAAKQLGGDRADATMARPVDALDFLSTYLLDSLNPVKGKSRIPLMNRKFLRTFGKDCDSILKRLGFTNTVELEDDGSSADVWYLPKVGPLAHPLDSVPSPTNILYDARYELVTIISRYPEHERTGVRHDPTIPQPAMNDLEMALGCLAYSKTQGRGAPRNASYEEDHPYYAGLGAVGDFSDALLMFAYSRQVAVDMDNTPYYFECLQDLSIGRASAELQTKVALLASNGQTNRREIAKAYRHFGIEPRHANTINEDHIIGSFRSRLSDESHNMVEETRKQLRIIGSARNSQRILDEASDAIETYEQALSYLGMDIDQTDDFIPTMYTVKVGDNAGSVQTARKAVKIIAEARNSQRLRDFLANGLMPSAEMEVGEAYALLNIGNRTEKIDMEVLKNQLDLQAADNPESSAKYEQAFQLVQQDQAQNYNNYSNDTSAPYSTRHPLQTWPVGCKNIGNTCYLNSVLQFLFTVKPLREMVLNCDTHLQETTPEALSAKKNVGRSKVTAEQVDKARHFVLELRKLFEHMISAPTYTVKPEINLAGLALTKSDEPDSQQVSEESIRLGLGEIGGIPVSGPALPPQDAFVGKELPTPADSVMGDEDANGDTDSMEAMDFSAPATDLDTTNTTKPEPPSRPPPVPPRPQTSNEPTIKKIEFRARQQDASEIMQNIFDLLSCAVVGTGVMRDDEQRDLIKDLFFSDVTTVRKTQSIQRIPELMDTFIVSPGLRDRPLYSCLDDDFGLDTEDDKATARYRYIDVASPIQIINVKRAIYEKGTSAKDESHIKLDKVLYLDRYLNKTMSLSEDELQQRREKQWKLQARLKLAGERQKVLRLEESPEMTMSLPEVVEETAIMIDNISEQQATEQDGSGDSAILDYHQLTADMRTRANELQKELKGIDGQMTMLEQEVDSIFEDCRDYPYRLHAVFMHRGSAGGGHYWIYIYDFQENIWRKYNDEAVDEVDEDEILRKENNNPATSTAIVYVRDDRVRDFTEAVCRKPSLEPSHDIEMRDVIAPDPEYKDFEIIDGVEQE